MRFLNLANTLVTGGSGYIARAFLHEYPEVHRTDLHNPFNDDKLFVADLTDYKKIEQYIVNNEISSVIHLAAFKSISESIKDPTKYLYNNIVSSLNIMQICESIGLPIVFASTAAIYGKENPYSLSKQIIENILKQSKVNYISLRYFNIGGLVECPSIYQNANVFDIIRKAYNTRSTFTLHNGSQPRDYSHIKDIVKITHEALDLVSVNSVRESFDVKSEHLTSLEELLEIYKTFGIFLDVEKKQVEELSAKKSMLTRFGSPNEKTLEDLVYSEIQYGLL